MRGDPRINRGGRPKGLFAFREHVQQLAERPALEALLSTLQSSNELARIRAAEVLLSYARGKPGQAIEGDAVDPAVAAAEQEAADRDLMEKLKRIEETLPRRREEARGTPPSSPGERVGPGTELQR